VTVIELIDPPRQITTRNLPDRTMTTYTLEKENDGTSFTVTESGFEALPESECHEHLNQHRSGWEKALESLEAFLDSRGLPS
jgi:hypothetical protein